MKKVLTFLLAFLLLTPLCAKAQLEYKQVGTIKANDYQFRTSYYPAYTMSKFGQGLTLYKKDFLNMNEGTLIKELTYFGAQTTAKTASITFTMYVCNTTETTVNSFIIEGEKEGSANTTVVDLSKFTKFGEVTWTNPAVNGSYTDPVEILTFESADGFEYTGQNLLIFVNMEVNSGSYPSTTFMTCNNGTAGNCIGAYREAAYNTVGYGINTKSWSYASGASVKLPVLKVGYAGARVAISATVKGKVVSSRGNGGIAGASVTLDGETVTTSSNGSYQFDLDDVDMTKTYTLSVSATGFESSSQTVDLRSGGTIELPNIVLTKLPVPATLAGKVINKSTLEGISGASVSFNGVNAVSASDGTYSIDITNIDDLSADGTVLSASASGYLPYSTTLQVKGDMDMNIEMEALPALPADGTLIGQWSYTNFQYSAPFNPLWNNTQQQFIYPQEMLTSMTSGQKVSSVTFYGYYPEPADPNTGGDDGDDDDYNDPYFQAPAPASKTYNLKLYIVDTDETSFSTSNPNVTSTEGLTPYFDGPVVIGTSGDQGHPVALLHLDFDIPYEYQGKSIKMIAETQTTNNAILYFCFDNTYTRNVIGRTASSASALETSQWNNINTGLPVVCMGQYVPTGELQGTVTDGKTGIVLEGVTVTLSGNGANTTVTTDETGAYSISLRGVALDAKYRVNFSLDSYIDDTQEVTFTSDNLSQTLNVALEKEPIPGVVNGKVTDKATNQPVAGASVALKGSSAVTTDTDGSYTLEIANIDYDGTYTLTVEAEGYYTVDEVFSFAEGETDKTLDVTLEAIPVVYHLSVEGTVYGNTDGTPVTLPDAKVTLTTADASVAVTTTDAMGKYSIEADDVDIDTVYSLTIEAEGYEQYNTQIFVTADDLAFNIDATLNAIVAVKNIIADCTSEAVYNLSGVKVLEAGQDMNKLEKGIYIIKGKKLIMK